MMRMRYKMTGLSPMYSDTAGGGGSGGGGGGGAEVVRENWEVRPSGMLVQKRVNGEQTFKPPPTIRVRVKYGSIYHDVYINSQATFGELKKKLAGVTGLHHQDMKVYYKDKEKDSKEFLDMVGVKDKSKIVLVEDPISHEKRILEMRKNAKLEKVANSISQISFQVDRLAGQVAALESVILKGGRVAEKDITSVIELLMNEVIKLDGIVADGDVRLQKNKQVTRVKKYVETLDMLKVKNSMSITNENHTPYGKQQKFSNGNAKTSITINGYGHYHAQTKNLVVSNGNYHQQEQLSTSGIGTVVTTQWETFEAVPSLIHASPTSSFGSATPKLINPKFPWDFE